MGSLYSIGYGNRSWAAMLPLLQRHGCQFLIDVRSSPFSRFNPDFSKENLSGLCANAGIRYVFMGDTLGGKPSEGDSFDPSGKVDYIKLAETNGFRQGLARLKSAERKGCVSFVMCSELKPEMCHRCKLIGSELAEQGIGLIHIDEKGECISQEEAMERLTNGQADMFGSPKSTRSRGSYGGAR